MSKETIHFESITQEQAKQFNGSYLRATEGLLLHVVGKNVDLDLGPEAPPIFPKKHSAPIFHYMEHGNEEDPTDPFTYWVVSISWPKTLFTKERHVLVLKAARSDQDGKEVPMDKAKLN